ncbi:hypothetical protein F4803DRAFT_556971 [Xylaria telfairii]|nr:hypothetical protein F4803DRAFT_556971 [Xylaria telfairii]
MKQWITLMDGIDNLKLETTPDPTELKEDEVLRTLWSHASMRAASSSVSADRAPDCSGKRMDDRVFSLARSNHLTAPMLPEHAAACIGIPLPGVLAQYRVFSAAGLVRTPKTSSSVSKEAGAGKVQIAGGMRLIQRNASLKGINIGPRDRVEEMMKLVYEERSVRPVVDRLFGFADVKAALEHLWMGSHFGKVVVRVDDEDHPLRTAI